MPLFFFLSFPKGICCHPPSDNMGAPYLAALSPDVGSFGLLSMKNRIRAQHEPGGSMSLRARENELPKAGALAQDPPQSRSNRNLLRMLSDPRTASKTRSIPAWGNAPWNKAVNMKRADSPTYKCNSVADTLKAFWTFIEAILFAIAMILAYVVSPVALAVGWMVWIYSHPKQWNILSVLSFSGFITATASAAFAIWTILYASSDGFKGGYGLFYRVIAWGGILSILSLVCSIAGIWRKGPLRWWAPFSSLGTLAFWMIATTWP